MKAPVTRVTQKCSWLPSRLPRRWNFQSWKTLRQTFQKFHFKCLAACLVTCTRLNSVVNIAFFAQIGQFLKRLGFPSNFLCLFIVFPFEPLSNPPCYSQKSPLLLIISTSIFKNNVWVFLFFLSISCSLPWTSWFVSCYWDLRFIDGWIWVFDGLLRLLCGLCWICAISLCLWLHNVLFVAHTHSMTWLWS